MRCTLHADMFSPQVPCEVQKDYPERKEKKYKRLSVSFYHEEIPSMTRGDFLRK
jgi:hypothetical protein